MKEKGNDSNVMVNPDVTQPVNRVRASGPILILAVLFVVGSFLAWYFTWFGRGLSDADISKYVVDYQRPRHVQHALLQIQERIERGDPAAKQWYPQILFLANNPETEYRLTSAWVMGADNKSSEFHEALKKLLEDPEPIVRRNAALALVRFNDASGHRELVAILQPYTVQAVAAGTVVSTLSSGAQVSRGSLLARIREGNNEATVRSPLLGVADRILVTNGANVSSGVPLMTIKSDEGSVWEALRGLAVLGTEEDLPIVERFAGGAEPASERIKQQAAQTVNAIKSRRQG